MNASQVGVASVLPDISLSTWALSDAPDERVAFSGSHRSRVLQLFCRAAATLFPAFSICAFGVLVARPLFQAERGGSIPTKALRFIEITHVRAGALVKEWHRTLPEIGATGTMKVCYGALYDGELYAVAMWSNPVARMLPQYTYLELRRFAIAPDAPVNTATRMLAWMARDIHGRYPQVERLISYQDCAEHDGTIYRAASDWQPVELNHMGGEWANRERWQRTAKRIAKKVRWEKDLT